jgi:hypothetical protein
MISVTTKSGSSQPQSETAVHLFDNWIDPLETEILCLYINLKRRLEMPDGKS